MKNFLYFFLTNSQKIGTHQKPKKNSELAGDTLGKAFYLANKCVKYIQVIRAL